MVCRNFILPEFCKPCLFLSYFQFAQFIVPYLQEFHSIEHLKQELIEYLDCYNKRRIKTKLKGLPPALHRQQVLSVA
jgi:putative transposase